MNTPKGITFNKDRNKFRVIYKGIFCGYYDNLPIALQVHKMIDMKYLQDYKKLMTNLKEYVNLIKGGNK